MEWSKKRAAPLFDLANSNILPCSIDELPGAREALDFEGSNYEGYAPLIDAIAARYGVSPAQVTTAQGASGANFLVCAALLDPGDEVLVETPGYDPLFGTPRLFAVQVNRFTRSFADGYAIDPGSDQAAMTPRTRLIIITSPHNPSGVVSDAIALKEIGAIAQSHNAHVLLDEVYLDRSRDLITCGRRTGCRSAVTSRRVRLDQQPHEIVRALGLTVRLDYFVA